MNLPVQFGGRRVADITDGPDGFILQYIDTWLNSPLSFPVSFSLPLQVDPHGGELVRNWLINYLPEGASLRKVAEVSAVSSDDVMQLMERLGRDLAGALSIGTGPLFSASQYRSVNSASDLTWMMKAVPFLASTPAYSMSLSGPRPKLPVAIIGDEMAIPVNGKVSTHIVKTDSPDMPGGVKNEAFCMMLAARLGLPVAKVATMVAGSTSYLLVERYDRSVTAEVKRLHQEDFCQALGRAPSAKTEYGDGRDEGVTLEEMFAFVRQHMSARDINRLLDAVIFNVAIGNVDAHAKNYSILIGRDSQQLAPLYGLRSSLTWRTVPQRLPQSVGGCHDGRLVRRYHWRRLAEAAGLSGRGVVRRVQAMTARLMAVLPAVQSAAATLPGDNAHLDSAVEAIRTRAGLVHTNAARGEEPTGTEIEAVSHYDSGLVDGLFKTDGTSGRRSMSSRDIAEALDQAFEQFMSSTPER